MIELQTSILLFIGVLICCDIYVTYSLYKQNELDCTSMKYDIELLRTNLNTIFHDVEGHKQHIIDLKNDTTNLERDANILLAKFELAEKEIIMLKKSSMDVVRLTKETQEKKTSIGSPNAEAK